MHINHIVLEEQHFDMATRIILAFAMMLAITSGGAPLYIVEVNSSSPGQNELFEGDIIISEELIQQYYNMSSIGYPIHNSSIREVRAVGSGSNVDLWQNAIVPYTIASGFSLKEKRVIRLAMNRWEQTTCLWFVARRSQWDYIHFQNSGIGCSSHLGRQGGKQPINLGNGCVTFRTILHEIGHAIGFWHEQSRPDRDSYVTINWNNVQTGNTHNFMKRRDSEIDSQCSGYDYRSIMHYRETQFVKNNCPSCKTIEVSNNAAYVAQGSPTLGQLNDLSSSDILQANRLYSCAGTGMFRRLTFRVKYGRRLKDTDGWWNLSDPYVKITAVSRSGRSHVRMTRKIQGTLNPNWNVDLAFPQNEWQYFKIQVWDEDVIWDDPMSWPETVVIAPGRHYNRKHCANWRCHGYVSYDYYYVCL